MRLRRRPLRNRKSARLARISAPPQHSVYPAVSQNDNHRCREQQRTPFQKPWWPPVTPFRCRRHTPQNCRASVHRNTAVHAGGRDRARQRRNPAAGGDGWWLPDPAPRLAHKSPRLRSHGRSARLLKGIFRSRRAGQHLPGSGERGRRRTRQDQISRGGFGPR
jgi:hypothetical protein